MGQRSASAVGWTLVVSLLLVPLPVLAEEAPEGTVSTAPDDSGAISVTSRPAGASVRVDGSGGGVTPALIGIAAGEHEVVVQLGEWTLRRPISIEAGRIASAHVTFDAPEPQPEASVEGAAPEEAPPSAVAAAAVEELVARLASGDEASRALSLRGLAQSADLSVVPHLVDRLERDGSVQVRRWAARGLAELPSAESTAALRAAAARDPDEGTRRLAATLAGVPATGGRTAPPRAAAGQDYEPMILGRSRRRRARRASREPPADPRRRRARRAGRGLVIGGWACFGTLYLISAGTGLVMMSMYDEFSGPWPGWQYALPIVGPFVALPEAMDAGAGEAAFSILMGIGQVAGFALLITGHVRMLSRPPPGDQDDSWAARPPPFIVAPMITGDTLGLSATVPLR